MSAIKVHADWAFMDKHISPEQHDRIRGLKPLRKSREKQRRKKHGVEDIRLGNKKLKPTLRSLIQIDELIDSIETKTLKGKRDLALFLTFIDLDLRVGEALALGIDHVNFFDQQQIVYREKVNITQELYLSPRLERALRDYFSVYPKDKIKKLKEMPLFISLSRKEKYFGTQITVRSVQKLFKKKGLEIGVGTPFSPHDLRHTWATTYNKFKPS